MKIFYLCDRKQCADCFEGCMYTSDITHAKNFSLHNFKVRGEEYLEKPEKIKRASAKPIKISGTEYILIKGEKGILRVSLKEADEILDDLKLMYYRLYFGKPSDISEEDLNRESYLYEDDRMENSND